MSKLNIEKLSSNSRTMDTLKITGFQKGELEELKFYPHEQAKDKLLDMLNERNSGYGTCLHNGYGIYGLWFDNEAAYMNVGKSCD